MTDEGHPRGKPDRDPSALVWALASISLVLPWLAAFVAIWGAVELASGSRFGWWLLGAGLLLFVLDIGIDFVWAQPSVLSSDEPDLNRRGQQLVDRRAVVAEPISGGRGKIRLGDSLWLAEGPDMEVGTAVRIRAAHGTVLEVEPAE